jgi:plasmid stabilization system protein ParE
MSLRIEKAEHFVVDFSLQFARYATEGGAELAFRFQQCLDSTLVRLSNRPDIGRVCRFRHPSLQGLRSFQVNRPFGSLLVFYRFDTETMHAVRLMHGARDLPRRLHEPPE